MTSFRRSTLQGFAECPRRTLHEIQAGHNFPRGNVGVSADLGSAAHAVFAEILRTLRRQGEPQMATEDAIVVLREVMANGKWVLPLDAPGTLRPLLLNWLESLPGGRQRAFGSWSTSSGRVTWHLPNQRLPLTRTPRSSVAPHGNPLGSSVAFPAISFRQHGVPRVNRTPRRHTGRAA